MDTIEIDVPYQYDCFLYLLNPLTMIIWTVQIVLILVSVSAVYTGHSR